MFKLYKPKILQEVGESKKGVFLQVLIFFGLFLLLIISQALVTNFIVKKFPTIDESIIYNFTAIVSILIYILIYKVFKNKSFNSFGYKKEGFIKDYSKGLLIGLLLSFLMVLICVLSNAITIEIIFTGWKDILYSIIIFVSYIFQALNEETLMRGHLLIQCSRKSQNIWIGILANLIIFTFLHISNSIIGSLNIALLGFLLSIIFIKRGSIWMCSGIHMIWNFMLHILGINVSGIQLESPIFAYKYNQNLEIINGGSFGFEGSIILTFLILIGIFLSFRFQQCDKVE